MQVICPSCHAQIPSDDMNVANMIARCRRCHSLIDLGQFVTHEDTGQHHSQVPQPSGLSVDDSGPGLRIVYDWCSFVYVPLAVLCIVWDSSVVACFLKALSSNGPWLAMAFTVAPVAMGVGLTYCTLAVFLNDTTVTVDGELLTIRHGPLPWWGNRTLYTDTLKQLYTQQKRHWNDYCTIFVPSPKMGAKWSSSPDSGRRIKRSSFNSGSRNTWESNIGTCLARCRVSQAGCGTARPPPAPLWRAM